MRGRPAKELKDEDLIKKQQKNHEYYLKFKNKHPGYYKKKEKVENVENVDDVPKENVELNKKNELLKKIDNIIQSLNALKKLF